MMQPLAVPITSRDTNRATSPTECRATMGGQRRRAFPSPSRCSLRARSRSCASRVGRQTRAALLLPNVTPARQHPPHLSQGWRLGVHLLPVLPAAAQAPGTAHRMAQLHGLGILPRLSCRERLPRPDSRRQSQRVEFARLRLPFFCHPGGRQSRLPLLQEAVPHLVL